MPRPPPRRDKTGQLVERLAHVLSLDNPVSGDRTRQLLGWEPAHPGLIEDFEDGHYFAR